MVRQGLVDQVNRIGMVGKRRVHAADLPVEVFDGIIPISGC